MMDRLRRALSFRSFRSKLMVTAIVCLLLPATITLAVYNYLTRDAVKDQAVSNAEESLLLVDGYVSNLLKYMLYIANYVQMDTDMNTILKEVSAGKTYEGPNAEYERFTDLSKIMNKIDNLTVVGEKSYVTILLTNGTYYTNYQSYEFDPKTLFEKPWMDKVNSLYGFESFWVGGEPTEFRTERIAGNPYQMSVVRTLRGQGRDVYGYVFVTVMENQVSRMFETLAAGQDMMLLGSDNVVLSHKDSAQIGTRVSYLDQQPKSDPHIIRVGGEDYLISRHKQSYTGWQLVSLMPYKEAIHKINSIFSTVFLFQILFFVLFLLLLLYLLRTFTKPLIRLDKVATTVQRGILDTRSHIRGHDEIGRLGYSFDQMLDRIQEMIAEITLTQARKRKAELAMLQAQINPHFLFNVLNSIRMKVLGRGDKESADMISSLSKLLRMTINRDEETIAFHEEVEIVIDYMQLMNMRQKQKVKLEVDVSADALLVHVPRFVLQPVIENALIHGLNQREGIIVLRACMDERFLVVAIEDNGQGMDERELHALRQTIYSGAADEPADPAIKRGMSGIGLPNVYERMRMTYGERFKLEADSRPGEGTRITMFIPIAKGG